MASCIQAKPCVNWTTSLRSICGTYGLPTWPLKLLIVILTFFINHINPPASARHKIGRTSYILLGELASSSSFPTSTCFHPSFTSLCPIPPHLVTSAHHPSPICLYPQLFHSPSPILFCINNLSPSLSPDAVYRHVLPPQMLFDPTSSASTAVFVACWVTQTIGVNQITFSSHKG